MMLIASPALAAMVRKRFAERFEAESFTHARSHNIYFRKEIPWKGRTWLPKKMPNRK